jgi:uncharacterized protein DUF2806
VTQVMLIGPKARGEAKKIDQIGEAIRRQSSSPISITYEDESATIKTIEQSSMLADSVKELELRTKDRVEFQAEQEQLRIENIVSKAAPEFGPNAQVPSNPPDDDWIARFFESAKTISSEQLQQLWARILAGEIKNPGSYSLWALDIARNMTQKTATDFENLVKISFSGSPEDRFIPADESNQLLRERSISDATLIGAADLGLIRHPQVAISLFELLGFGTAIQARRFIHAMG